LSTSSFALIFAGLIVAGMGAPLPEDVLLLAGGAIADRSHVHYAWITLLCSAGVLLGDLALFFTARRLGQAALDRPLFRRLLSPKRRRRAEEFFERHGLAAIFIARHVAGLRAATFALAGINRVSWKLFVLADGLGIIVSVPLFVWLGLEFAENLELVKAGIAQAESWLLIVAAVLLGGYGTWVVVHRWWARQHPVPSPPER
jgi:membrane protein DedA with SNARE-associated domain